MSTLRDLLVMLLIFDCSENVGKKDIDVARPEYACQVHVVSSTYLFSRRIKIKTEKAIYAEKVGEDSSIE